MAAERREGSIIRGLILGMVLHGIFNLLLISAEVVTYATAIFILVLIPGLWILVDRNIRSALRWQRSR